ncbi:unnamed protein product, partial [Didymodactylos carnosus]
LSLRHPSVAFIEDQHTIWLHQRQRRMQAENAATLLQQQQLPEFLPLKHEEYLNTNVDNDLLSESAQRTAAATANSVTKAFVITWKWAFAGTITLIIVLATTMLIVPSFLFTFRNNNAICSPQCIYGNCTLPATCRFDFTPTHPLFVHRPVFMGIALYLIIVFVLRDGQGQFAPHLYVHQAAKCFWR